MVFGEIHLGKERVVVYLSGCWDLFHIGHLRVLQKAKQLGDILVVGVCTDEFATSYKNKPIISYEQRREIVNGLKYGDVVIAHPCANYAGFVADHNVTVRAAGPDFGHLEGQREFREFAKAHGVEIVTIPRTPNISTTIIKEKIKNEQE